MELAKAMDARAAELAQRQAETPEPWVLVTLGAFPAEGSEQLRADWLGRIGQAASYREMARITDPNIVIGPAPQGHPELMEAHASAASMLELETEDRMVYAMTRGQLEATTAEYERIAQHAPPEVSAELKAERTAELDARARGTELAELGQREAGQAWQTRADAADVRATVLEGKAEAYTAWEAEHRAQRELAERARAELARRNTAERQREAVPREPEVQEPEVQEPEPREAEVQEPEVAEATADSSATEVSPQVTTGALAEEPSRIADPELARAAAELDAHQAERQAAAQDRAAERADRLEERATREASRAAAEAEAGTVEAGSPGAWVPGRDTPSYGGPGATTPEPAPAAEAEAGL